MEIATKDWDELYLLFLELERITYLQGLVHYEQEQKSLLDIDYESIRSYTQKQLWEQLATTTEAIKTKYQHIIFANKTDG